MQFIQSRDDDGRDCMHEEIEDNEKRSTASSSLPNDVVEEIFIRLPVKTLIRFKSLSKQWSLRIKSHSFAEKHLNMARSYQVNHPSLMLFPSQITNTEVEFQPFCLEGRRPLSDTQLSFPLGFLGWIQSSNSCDGLFCIQSSKSTYVVNPATRWFRPLPLSRYQILNPTNVPWKVGITAALVKAVHYKLVLLYNSFHISPNEGVTTCEVFDFRANAWRYLTSTPNHSISSTKPESADGSLFWFTELYNYYEINVIAFDIHTEKFRLLPKFHPVTSNSLHYHYHCSMCILDDRLCILATTSILEKKFWRLKSSEDMWEKIFTIDYLSTPLSWIPYEFWWRPVTMWKKNKMLLSHPCSGNLVILNLQTRSVRIIDIRSHTDYILGIAD
ncbi:hypothetical protein Bca101_008861 [Brassica carinata]